MFPPSLLALEVLQLDYQMVFDQELEVFVLEDFVLPVLEVLLPCSLLLDFQRRLIGLRLDQTQSPAFAPGFFR